MRTKRRSLFGITVLTIITFGLYPIYWFFITKTEMNTVNGVANKVPFFLWFFIPIINIWWFWRFSKAIEKTTKGTVNRWAAFFAPVILEILGGFLLSITYPIYTAPNSNVIATWGAILMMIVVSLLPIYYFQSNLNKYAK